MNKLKKFLTAIVVILGLGVLADIVCFSLGVISVALFASLLGVGGVGILVATIFLAKALKKRKDLDKEKGLADVPGMSMADLYGYFGIPIQYNKDGSIKDIYELLGFEPEFDENGKRILTPYEQLGIMPMVDENGNEIPGVFAVKNRVGKAAKVDLSTRVLKRKLTEKEQEELVVKEVLKQRLDEARASGDKSQEDAIKKMIAETGKKPGSKEAPKEKSESEWKPVKYKTGKGAKPVGAPKPDGRHAKFDGSRLLRMPQPVAAIFGAAANGEKHAQQGEQRRGRDHEHGDEFGRDREKDDERKRDREHGDEFRQDPTAPSEEDTRRNDFRRRRRTNGHGNENGNGRNQDWLDRTGEFVNNANDLYGRAMGGNGSGIRSNQQNPTTIIVKGSEKGQNTNTFILSQTKGQEMDHE